jgi:adenylate cyclase
MAYAPGAESRICRGCWDQMHVPIPIRGPLSLPLRLVGIAQSKMNPNICTICERAFRRVQKQRHVTVQATILFADIRGFTALSERLGAAGLSDIVGTFQDQCARHIWAQDGIVNKQMGDGLMAIFNFPIRNGDHAGAAIRAALDIQRNCPPALAAVLSRLDTVGAAPLAVGVGVHSGPVEIGEFSTDRSDFTAIGSTVNLAARLESGAAGGEVVVSAPAAALAPDLTRDSALRDFHLKGFDRPVPAHVLRAG